MGILALLLEGATEQGVYTNQLVKDTNRELQNTYSKSKGVFVSHISGSPHSPLIADGANGNHE